MNGQRLDKTFHKRGYIYKTTTTIALELTFIRYLIAPGPLYVYFLNYPALFPCFIAQETAIVKLNK